MAARRRRKRRAEETKYKIHPGGAITSVGPRQPDGLHRVEFLRADGKPIPGIRLPHVDGATRLSLGIPPGAEAVYWFAQDWALDSLSGRRYKQECVAVVVRDSDEPPPGPSIPILGVFLQLWRRRVVFDESEVVVDELWSLDRPEVRRRTHGCDPSNPADWTLARRGDDLLDANFNPPGKKEGDRDWTVEEFVKKLETALDAITERRADGPIRKLGGVPELAPTMAMNPSTFYDYLKDPELAWLRSWWEGSGGARELMRRWHVGMHLHEVVNVAA